MRSSSWPISPSRTVRMPGRRGVTYGRGGRGPGSDPDVGPGQRGAALGDPHGGRKGYRLLLRTGRYGSVDARNLNRGVQESLKLIGAGGRIQAWLPADMAYGAEGDAELGIAPNATLYYEIELLDVDKYANRFPPQII